MVNPACALALPTLRRADPATADAYPLPVAGPVHWHRQRDSCTAELPLPTLAAGMLVAPSLVIGDAPSRRQCWTLVADGSAWTLPPLPGAAPPSTVTTDSRASTHIDCLLLHAALPAPRLRIELEGSIPPQRYLLTVSARLHTQPQVPLPRQTAALPAPPPALSQMLAPAALARRICSPTSVAMVLALWGRGADWLDIVAECHDPASNLYGIWPLAIAAAARRGSFGAIELFHDWTQPLSVLAQGIPLVTSIRFETNALPGAPLPRSSGHLVVLSAVGPDTVRVNDPAAPTLDTVVRTYPTAAFAAAWLASRGAAYILPP